LGRFAPHIPTTTLDDPEPIVLRRGAHTWRFVWSASDIPELIQTLSDMAENDLIDLDWFDAALVIYELGRRLESITPRHAAKNRSEAS
jgi:hypothetical protein